MATLIKETELRLVHVAVDSGYEDRMSDLAIEALSDIDECDGASVLVKWSKTVIPGSSVPLLYVFFRAGITSDVETPKVHLSDGGAHPCHAMSLVRVPSMRLILGQEARDLIRADTERFMLRYGIRQKRHNELGAKGSASHV